MQTITVELIPNRYGDQGAFETPSRFNAAGRDQNYRYNGHSFALGFIDATGSCRRETGGPVLPGPYAYSYGLGTLIVADRAVAKRISDTHAAEIRLEDGDVLTFNGVEFVVTPVRHSREHFTLELQRRPQVDDRARARRS